MLRPELCGGLEMEDQNQRLEDGETSNEFSISEQGRLQRGTSVGKKEKAQTESCSPFPSWFFPILIVFSNPDESVTSSN